MIHKTQLAFLVCLRRNWNKSKIIIIGFVGLWCLFVCLLQFSNFTCTLLKNETFLVMLVVSVIDFMSRVGLCWKVFFGEGRGV